MQSSDSFEPSVLQLVRHEVSLQTARLHAELVDLRSQVAALESKLCSLTSAGNETKQSEPERWAEDVLVVRQNSRKLMTKTLSHRRASESEDSTKAALPESLLGYCLARLAVSTDPWRDPVMAYLLLLVGVQQVLMVAFSECNNLVLFADQWTLTQLNPPQLSPCVFASRSTHGFVVMDLVVSFIAMILVAATIKADDMQQLAMILPHRKSMVAFSIFIRFVWFIQCVYLPACFAVAAATLFANSSDSEKIIMNTLAVTFIMEIDDVLYHNFLSSQEKSEYQAFLNRLEGWSYQEVMSTSDLESSAVPATGESLEAADSSRSRAQFCRLGTDTISSCSWHMFFCSLSMMCFMFVTLLLHRYDHYKDFHKAFGMQGCTAYTLLYGLRALLQDIAYARDNNHTLIYRCAIFVGSCVIGVAWYMFMSFCFSSSYLLWQDLIDTCLSSHHRDAYAKG